MNGVHPPMENNRFSDLAPETGRFKKKNKRPRTEVFIPLPQPSLNDNNYPQFLVASTRTQKEGTECLPLSSYNVFRVEKGLNFISRNRLEVNEMRNGDLLIKVADGKTADKFLKATHIDTIPVLFSLHKTLNSVQGRVFSRKIIAIPENELLESLKDQNVIDIRKITKNVGTERIATGAAIVTFNLFHRPNFLKLGWERVKVEEYIPNPMRCVNCQKLGHTKNHCRNIQHCKDCGLPTPHDCCSRKFCVNCQADGHTSYDPHCRTFWKHKSVNYLRITKKCSTREAWNIYNDNPVFHTLKPFSKNDNKKQTFSQVVNGTLSTNDTSSTSSQLPSKQSTSAQLITSKQSTIISPAKLNLNNKSSSTKKTLSLLANQGKLDQSSNVHSNLTSSSLKNSSETFSQPQKVVSEKHSSITDTSTKMIITDNEEFDLFTPSSTVLNNLNEHTTPLSQLFNKIKTSGNLGSTKPPENP